MAQDPDRTLSKRFCMLLPVLTVPSVFALIVLPEDAAMLFGIAYGVSLVLLATAVGVYRRSRRLPRS